MIAAWLLALATATPVAPGSVAGCAHVADLRSHDQAPPARPVQHAFENGGGVPLQLSWVDPQGKRIAIDTIAPGAFKSLQTYVGHAFVLTDPAGKCRATIRVDDVFSGSYVGASRYRPAAVSGWHVYIDHALDPAREPARSALATLEAMLSRAEAALPGAALAQVRHTPIFLLDHSGPGGMFHYSPDWLVAHGRTVDFTNAIEISDASVFVDTARVQPEAVLHELAHSYYRNLSDAERAEVETAYRTALAHGLYRAVKRHDGSVMPAYAAGNALEYFAEASEAYFGRNDFYPFTRADLIAYDPEIARLLARLWR